MFHCDFILLAAKHRPVSRVLNLCKPQSEPKSKSKRSKTSAPHRTRDNSSKAPHEHRTPGVPPNRSVVKSVREVSSNDRPSVSINNQGDRSGPSSANDPTTSSAGVNPRSPSCKSAPGLGDCTKKPPTHETNGSGEPRGKENARESVNLLLGQQTTNAAYFTRRYVALPCSQNARIPKRKPSETLHHCDELDPEAFEAYRRYRKTGRLEFSCSEDVRANDIWMACWPIMNAVVLGHTLGHPEFANMAMDLLVERLPPGICPDVETIKHLFDENHTTIPNSLRKLAVDRFLDAIPYSSSNMEVSQYPPLFQSAVLHAALERLSHRSNPVVKSSRDYHSHGATEACHKQMPEINGTLKGKERAHVYKECAGDAEAVAKTLEENGIKNFDWAYRRDTATPNAKLIRAPILLPLLPNSGSQAGKSSKKPPDRRSLASAAAELERLSRAGTPFATNLASRYKRSFGPTFRSGGQAKADSVGHSGTYNAVKLECPGAYPESISSGSGV